MPGVMSDEGIIVSLERVLANSTTKRGTNLLMGLFTNSSGIDATTTWQSGTITEPTIAGGYAEITLTDANWSVAGGLASQVLQEFAATGAAFSGDVYGYYVRTNTTPSYLICFEVEGTATTVADGGKYNITPSIGIAGGANGIFPVDGKEMFLNLMFKNVDINRGTNLSMKLYANAGVLDENTALIDMTQLAVLNGHTEEQLLDVSWVVTNQDAIYGVISQTAVGGNFSDPVYGMDIYSNGTVPKLLHISEYSGAPVTVALGDSYDADITQTGD